MYYFVFRIFLVPLLPTNTNELHLVTNQDLVQHLLILELDEEVLSFNLNDMASGEKWPFIAPLNTQHPRPACGIGSYVPFCYQKSLKIVYQHNIKLSPNLFEQTINCTLNDLLCPYHIYSDVSRLKYPSFTKIEPYKDESLRYSNLLSYLSSPVSSGPPGGGCRLECVEICSKCKRTLFISQSSGVVTSIRMRLFVTASSTPLQNWNHILLTMQWDYSMLPQVDKLPLGSFFGMTGSGVNDRGASMGHGSHHCKYKDSYLDLPEEAQTGYFYLPLPYWQKALIQLEGSEFLTEPQTVCYEVMNTPNYYDRTTTGHFYSRRQHFSQQTDGWRSIVSLENFWGHIVTVLMETDNLYPQKDGPLSGRWAALQADPVLFLDGSKSATYLGEYYAKA